MLGMEREKRSEPWISYSFKGQKENEKQENLE
jgi:hypothetical protein